MSVDSIGDFLTVIRNGAMVAKPEVVVPYSKMRAEIASILKDEGFIRNFEVLQEEGSVRRVIKVRLKYVKGESVIHQINRVSTPGRRRHCGVREIVPVIGGLGVSILTTSQGIITNKEAKKRNIGGEIICTVW